MRQVTGPPSADGRHPFRVAVLIAIACIALTVLATWATARVDRNAERRLLQVQTEQAGEVLSTATLLIQQPLATALSAQAALDRDERSETFTRSVSTYVGGERLFRSASLWIRRGNSLSRVAHVGARPVTGTGERALTTQLRSAFGAGGLTTRLISADGGYRISYALADARSGFAVVGERQIPPDRRSIVDQNAAFADLHYAIYLGPRTTSETLATTDQKMSDLPLSGRTAQVTIPFGDSVLTLVTSPRRHLGSTLSQRLPLYLFLGGLLITVAAARGGHQLVRGRQQVERSYDAQREVFERLQRALLPHALPAIPDLQIAAEYVAGAQGIDIGGDWYSIIGLDEERFGFVVGDVSGRGIDAVAVMAHARFTVRAYLLDGHTPAEALERCSYQFDIATDGHMTTAVVGIGNWRTGDLVLASAGHPPPALVTAEGTSFVGVKPGRPLGTGPATYASTTLTLEPGETLFCYTDGLVERRTEDIDTGLRRLAGLLTPLSGRPVHDLISSAVGSLRSDDAADDIAVLAFRREAR